ncbi:MAG TPA: hypothetical protein VLA79_11510 [Polyangia bacterium]|nr:hypothetical protein [Polyangia bacterium]
MRTRTETEPHAPAPLVNLRLGRLIWRRRFAFVYLACLCAFARQIARFGDRQTGYSSLILFGDHFAPQRLRQLADIPLYTYARQVGYDGQFYAQMAVAGNPFNRDLARALDAPAYRERRILLPLAIHAVGLGRPRLIIQAFALANLFCLALLAALLARWWFPPTDLDNLIRWAGILFGAGLVVSATRSLTDGPALLLIAIGARQLERGRTWPAAVVLGLAGLVRETSVLCAGACWPSAPRDPGEPIWPARRRALLATLICVGPIVLWTAILFDHYGRIGGLRNLAPPFFALAGKTRELVDAWRTRGFDRAVRDEVLIATTLAVQIGFLIVHPQPREPWWRIGASFAAFAAFLGWPVWEGFPSAAARALLPVSLAFNRLVPRTRRGLLLLAVGNLSLLALPDLFDSIVPTEQVAFVDGVAARYGEGWLVPERAGRDTWRWASGTAALTLDNPHPDPRTVTLDFQLRSVSARSVTVSDANDPPTAGHFTLLPDRTVPAHLGPLTLPPGETRVVFSTDLPPWIEPGTKHRHLSFSVHRLQVNVAPAP